MKYTDISLVFDAESEYESYKIKSVKWKSLLNGRISLHDNALKVLYHLL